MDLDRLCRLERDQIVVEGDGIFKEIAFSQCDTHEKILYWTDHFLADPAYKIVVVKRFIKTACQKHGLALGLR